MKVAIVGSRSIKTINLENYFDNNLLTSIDEIVTGGAKGIDSLAESFAVKHNIPVTVFLPEYDKYSKYAPLKRNETIASYADIAYIFWDSKSRGTRHIINCFKKENKEIILFIIYK